MELATLRPKLLGAEVSEGSACSSSSGSSASVGSSQRGDRRDAYRRHRKPRPGSGSSRRHTMSNESARSGSSRGSSAADGAELNLPLGREFLMLPHEEDAGDDVDELRREVLCKLFELPECTAFYQDFSCAIAASLAMHGRMYPTSSHVCFYSNVFGRERKILIPYETISELDKTTTMVFQSALRIRTTDGKEDYTFTSFWGNNRDSCYDLIAKTRERVLREIRPTVVQGIKRIAGGSPSAQTFNCGGTEEAVPTPESDQTESPTSPAGSRSSLQSVEHEAHTKDAPKETPAQEANAASTSDQTEQPATPEPKPTEVAQTASEKAEKITPGSSNVTPGTIPCLPRQRSVVSDVNSIAPKDDAMTHILDETFPMSVDEFMSTFFLDNAPFGMDKYGERTGSTEITVNPWMTPLESEASFGMTRSLQFRVPVEAPIGPKSSRVDVLQCLKTERHVRVVETSTRVVDIPYGDYFSVEDRWTIVPDVNNPKQCKVTIELKVVFAKSTFWKSTIESRAIGDNKAKWKEWVVMAKEFIASQKEATAIAKPTDQPSSSSSSNPPLSREPSSGHDEASQRYGRSKSIGQDRHRSSHRSRGRSSSRAMMSVRSRDARVKVFPWILVLVLLFIVVRLQATLSTIESSLELTSRRMLEMQQQLALIQQSTCPP